MQNGYQNVIDFAVEGTKFTFSELLQCVPLIKGLFVSKYYMEVVFMLKTITSDVRVLCLLILTFVFG